MEELKITTGNFKKLESLDFIKNNKKLKKLTINLRNSWGDDSTMDNLDVLKNFNQLEELKIIDVSTTNLNALSSCKNLNYNTLKTLYTLARKNIFGNTFTLFTIVPSSITKALINY